MEGKDRESKHKHRLKGLFSKEKRVASSEDDVDDFLRGSSDKLNFPAPTPTSPPRLSLRTETAKRWPSAAEIHKVARGRSASPKRNRKGLVVRFTDQGPEIIGEGGDEAELPTAELSLRNRAHTHPSRGQRSTDFRDTLASNNSRIPGKGVQSTDNFRPGPIRRTQTGYESISDTRGSGQDNRVAAEVDSNEPSFHDPKSFAARVKEEMRSGEGKALVKASSNISDPESFRSGSPVGDLKTHLDEVQRNTMNNVHIPPPPGLPSQLIPGRPSTPKTSQQSTTGVGDVSGANSRSSTSTTLVDSPVPVSRISTSNTMVESPERLSRSSTLTLHGATLALSDDALQEFSTRVTHLFTLFRLSAESIQPLSKCSIEQFIRAALWWFLHGRLNLEASVRDRPSSPEAQQANFSTRQQAHADLAKAFWLLEKVIPQFSRDTEAPDVAEIRQGIMYNLRKLTMSMKRNNSLPPEDAPLPQGLDSSIWVQEDGNQSLLASQKQASWMPILYSMPLGDSGHYFHFGRLFARGILTENGDSQEYRCLMSASLIRNPKEKPLSLIVTNQSGTFKLAIQADRSRGPTWEDVEWHAKTSAIDVRLPRGFKLQIQCGQQDFKTFWGMYDYQRKLYTGFKQQQDESLLFESTLRTFQYFDQDGKSAFPKDPIASCQLRVFEKVMIEKAAAGARNMHRGFRIGLITSPATKVLRGINQDLPPDLPIQFGFLRGEGGHPAFLLKIDSALKYTMVFTFDDVKERALLHTQLTGVSLRSDEVVVTEAQLKLFNVADAKAETEEPNAFKSLDWQSARVINGAQGGDTQTTGTVLSESLRVVMDFKTGSVTDRVNVGPGELKVRLDVTSSNKLRILRQPQQDMTVSVLESQVSKELPRELAELLSSIAKAETTHTYTFPSLKDLHLFQAALTGFSVTFDGMATSFNISRRRMVVPIYKKWDAVTTRVQIIQKEKIIQLIAFFENFSHGDCMNFALKSTDVFESSARSGKYSIRIVDAKFALPKSHGDGQAGSDKSFVCLDIPDYPGEHDDITIVFDNESDHEKFIKALPAPVKAASRMASVRR